MYYMHFAGFTIAADTSGTSFLVSFSRNYGEETTHFIVVTTHDQNVTIYLLNPTTPINRQSSKLFLQSHSSHTIDLGAAAGVLTNQVVEKKAVLVISSGYITVIGINTEPRLY